MHPHAASLLIVAAMSWQAPPPPPPPPAPSAQASPVQAARRQLASGNVDEAVAALRPLVAAHPDSFDANLALGMALDVQLHLDEARKYLQQALEVAPEDARTQALIAMAVSWVFAGSAKQAATFYQQVFDGQLGASNFDGAAATANAMGRVYLETGSGDLENARRWYQTGYETAKRVPDMPGPQLALWEYRWLHAQGRLAARSGQFDAARAKVTEARAMLAKTTTPSDEEPSWHYLAGYVELYAKQYNAALEHLAQADQKDPFVQMLIARSYEGLGQKDRAKEAWRAVMASGAHNINNAVARPLAVRALGL